MAIDSSDDTIDVRDIIARFEWLEEEREALTDAVDEAVFAEAQEAYDTAVGMLGAWDANEGPELEGLRTLLDDLKGNGGDEQWRGDWYPVTLIRDSYFEAHARELVEDCGYISKDFPNWIEIDWKATARNVRMDYTSTEIDGVTFWYR